MADNGPGIAPQYHDKIFMMFQTLTVNDYGSNTGIGLALVGAFFLFAPRPRKIDVAALPKPSADVRAKCDDPNCSLAEAVKAYRDETGLGLSEAKAALDSYSESKHLPEEDDTMT